MLGIQGMGGTTTQHKGVIHLESSDTFGDPAKMIDF